jgi:hypothetical protein
MGLVLERHQNCGLKEILVDSEKYPEQCLISKSALPVFDVGSTHKVVVTLG